MGANYGTLESVNIELNCIWIDISSRTNEESHYFFKISSSKYIHVYIYLIYNFRMSLKGNCFNTRLKDYVQTLCFGSR